jgi:3'-5' exoribonuclease
MTHTEKLRGLAAAHDVAVLCAPVLDDHHFSQWSGSGTANSHHYGKGGLAEHTYEVVKLCLYNNDMMDSLGKGLNPKKVFVAAVFHDAGKMWDYKPQPGTATMEHWVCTPHKKLIHHITRGVLLFNESAGQVAHMEHYAWLNDAAVNEITHAILAHHRQPDWGSPVVPKTRLAWLLHLCDAMSARFDDCEKKQ